MITKKLVLKFPKEKVEQPIIYNLVKDYNLVPNILKARVSSEGGASGFRVIGRR